MKLCQFKNIFAVAASVFANGAHGLRADGLQPPGSNAVDGLRAWSKAKEYAGRKKGKKFQVPKDRVNSVIASSLIKEIGNTGMYAIYINQSVVLQGQQRIREGTRIVKIDGEPIIISNPHWKDVCNDGCEMSSGLFEFEYEEMNAAIVERAKQPRTQKVHQQGWNDFALAEATTRNDPSVDPAWCTIQIKDGARIGHEAYDLSSYLSSEDHNDRHGQSGAGFTSLASADNTMMTSVDALTKLKLWSVQCVAEGWATCELVFKYDSEGHVLCRKITTREIASYLNVRDKRVSTYIVFKPDHKVANSNRSPHYLFHTDPDRHSYKSIEALAADFNSREGLLKTITLVKSNAGREVGFMTEDEGRVTVSASPCHRSPLCMSIDMCQSFPSMPSWHGPVLATVQVSLLFGDPNLARIQPPPFNPTQQWTDAAEVLDGVAQRREWLLGAHTLRLYNHAVQNALSQYVMGIADSDQSDYGLREAMHRNGLSFSEMLLATPNNSNAQYVLIELNRWIREFNNAHPGEQQYHEFKLDTQSCILNPENQAEIFCYARRVGSRADDLQPPYSPGSNAVNGLREASVADLQVDDVARGNVLQQSQSSGSVEAFRVLVLGRAMEQDDEANHSEEATLKWSNIAEKIGDKVAGIEDVKKIDVVYLDCYRAGDLRGPMTHAQAGREYTVSEVHADFNDEQWPLDASSFDVVMNDWSTLKFVYDDGDFAAKVALYLRPGGVAIFQDTERVHSEEEMRNGEKLKSPHEEAFEISISSLSGSGSESRWVKSGTTVSQLNASIGERRQGMWFPDDENEISGQQTMEEVGIASGKEVLYYPTCFGGLVFVNANPAMLANGMAFVSFDVDEHADSGVAVWKR